MNITKFLPIFAPMEAVIFDMDGVIVDSEPHWKEVERVFLRKLIPKWNDELQTQITGMSMYDVHDLLMRDYHIKMHREEFIGYYDSLAGEIYGKHSALIFGADKLIGELFAAQIALAVASSSPESWIDLVLARFGLREFFDVVVSAEHLDGRGKPFPDIYQKAAKLLGIPPQQCLAIEDTEKGVSAAKRAGIKCIGLRNGFNEHQDLREADFVIGSFAELSVERMRAL